MLSGMWQRPSMKDGGDINVFTFPISTVARMLERIGGSGGPMTIIESRKMARVAIRMLVCC